MLHLYETIAKKNRENMYIFNQKGKDDHVIFSHDSDFWIKWKHKGAHGSIVVKALCYKPQGRGFQTRWGELIFSIYLILPATLGRGVYSATNRNEYQKHKINNVSGE
jgi:hypothetical protein